MNVPVAYCLESGTSFSNNPDRLITEVKEQDQIYRQFEEFVLSDKFVKAFFSNKHVWNRHNE